MYLRFLFPVQFPPNKENTAKNLLLLYNLFQSIIKNDNHSLNKSEKAQRSLNLNMATSLHMLNPAFGGIIPALQCVSNFNPEKKVSCSVIKSLGNTRLEDLPTGL